MRTLHRNPDGSLANPYESVGWNTEQVVWEENLAEFFECVALKAEEYATYMRRRLFFAAMRRPEMRMLRLALRHLRDDQGIDWRTIQSIEDMGRYGWRNECWCMVTESLVVFTLDAATADYEDFLTMTRHQDGNPDCDCGFCEGAQALA